MLTALPSVLLAQQNIQKAFDALLNENIVEIKTQHTLERDPETGKKKAQMDIYDFEVANPTGISRVRDIQRADKDKEDAYELRSGDHAGNDYHRLAVGDGKSYSVAIGRIKGSNYIYALFLDKDDSEKIYRYAYALEWVEKDKKTQVRLAITYATTLQYRNSKRQTRTFIVNGEKVRVDGNSFSLSNGLPASAIVLYSTVTLHFSIMNVVQSPGSASLTPIRDCISGILTAQRPTTMPHTSTNSARKLTVWKMERSNWWPQRSKDSRLKPKTNSFSNCST